MLKKKMTAFFVTTLVAASFLNIRPVYADRITKSKGTSKKIVHAQSKNRKVRQKDQKVTIMYYCDADNNLEGNLLEDIEEMKRGYVNSPNLNLVALVDRSPNYSRDSKVLGENFTDTRLYKIEHNKAKRLSGGTQFPEISLNSNYEANMGDPDVLKKFIEYSKANYKADKYILIMANHGGGARKKSDPKLNRAICWDDTDNGDCLYMGEISDHLTQEHSVDLLAFDACLMGTAEVAYQYRPGNGGFSADSMVASSPVVWGDGFKYDNILKRIKAGGASTYERDLTLGGREKNFDPATITNDQLGAIFVEEQRDSTNAAGYYDQHLSYYNLSKVDSLKKSIDNLAINLSEENKKVEIEKLRGSANNTTLMHYFDENSQDEWIEYPYFDAYDLCKKISESEDFNKNTKDLALDVMNKLDDMIIYSFGNPYNNFKEGKNGLSIFLPDGGKNYADYYSGNSITHWNIQSWYNSIDTVKHGLKPYGKLSWCKDGQDTAINKVGNWFELLDSWFDKTNDSKGGVNKYQW